MTESGRTIRFLLGKRPREDTIFPELFADLAARGIGSDVLLPHEGQGIESTTPPALAVQRGLRPEILANLVQLERVGWRFCNPLAASRATQDRMHVMAVLRGAGLPVPNTTVLQDWAAGSAGRYGAVVKAKDGRIGRGAGVAFIKPRAWPAEPPFPGPWIIEDRIAGDGVDRKLYFAGDACRGLLSTWPRDRSVAHPFNPDAELVRLARGAGCALGLEIFGVDVLVGPLGPAIVDVNVFPGFRGINCAPRLIADHLTELLASGPR